MTRWPTKQLCCNGAHYARILLRFSQIEFVNGIGDLPKSCRSSSIPLTAAASVSGGGRVIWEPYSTTDLYRQGWKSETFQLVPTGCILLNRYSWVSSIFSDGSLRIFCVQVEFLFEWANGKKWDSHLWSQIESQQARPFLLQPMTLTAVTTSILRPNHRWKWLWAKRGRALPLP